MCPMASDTYTDIGNGSILSVTSSGERVIPFKTPFPVLMAVCSPNWSSDMEFQQPSQCRQTCAPANRSALALGGSRWRISSRRHEM